MAKKAITREQWETLAAASHYKAWELARLCNVSLRQLQREFRRQTGSSPQSWLDDRRIIASERLLLEGHPIKAVAFDLGYKQPSHFCRQFKERRQLTPSEFIALLVPRDMSLTDNECRSQISPDS